MLKIDIAPIQKIHLDRKSGKQTAVYFVADKVCTKVSSTTRSATQFAGYILLRADLMDAQAILSQAFNLVPPRGKATVAKPRHVLVDDHDQFLTIKALWFAAVVLYSKCFTKPAAGRLVKLERTALASDFRAAHDKVLEFRHTIVAHGSNDSHERCGVEVVFHPRRPKDLRFWVRTNSSRLHLVDDRNDPVPLSRLIEAALDYVNTRLLELEDRIKAEVVMGKFR